MHQSGRCGALAEDRKAVPEWSGEERQVPDAWRKVDRRTEEKQECMEARALFCPRARLRLAVRLALELTWYYPGFLLGMFCERVVQYHDPEQNSRECSKPDQYGSAF